jgi:hypothetical protein
VCVVHGGGGLLRDCWVTLRYHWGGGGLRQAFASRYPAPGQTAAGDIDSNLYYSTHTGPAHVAVLNNYVPFHQVRLCRDRCVS